MSRPLATIRVAGLRRPMDKGAHDERHALSSLWTILTPLYRYPERQAPGGTRYWPSRSG